MYRVDVLRAFALFILVAIVACSADAPNATTEPETDVSRLLPTPAAPGTPSPSPTPAAVGLLVLPADTTIEVGSEVTFRVIATMPNGGTVELPRLLINVWGPAHQVQTFSVSPIAPIVLGAVNVVSSARAWSKGIATVTVAYDGRVAYSRVTVK